VRFPIGVVHRVDDVDAARRFLVERLGFAPKPREAPTVLENGALEIRLVADGETSVLTIEVRCPDVAAAATELAAWPGVDTSALEHRTSLWRVERRVVAPHGLHILLAHHFTEDELGILPELPISLEWEAPTLALVQRLLRWVPLAFRDSARRTVTRQAERRAIEADEVTVTHAHALPATIASTPAFQHASLRRAFVAEGLEPERWFGSP
jgi:hypothetical protein